MMLKILHDDIAPGLWYADQTNYHLRNSATDLTLPQPKRGFLKSGAMLWIQLPNEENLAESRHSFKIISKRKWVLYTNTHPSTYLPNNNNNNNESLFHHKIKLHILCHNNYIKLFKNIISLQ